MRENTPPGQAYDSVSGARALPEPDRQTVLAEILGASSDRLIAFDLDSTLLDNGPRNARIMREFGHSIDQPLLQRAEPSHWTGWSALDAMTNMGVSLTQAEDLQKAHRQFWLERFFTSEYCTLDDAIAGAVAYVRKLNENGARIVYLTGRPETMRSGTMTSFDQHGFPLPNQSDCQLWMKPNANANDDEFKKTAFESLRDIGSVLAAFDNEPTHINAYRQAFPDATCIHLLTDHSMRPVKLLDNILSIEHF